MNDRAELNIAVELTKTSRRVSPRWGHSPIKPQRIHRLRLVYRVVFLLIVSLGSFLGLPCLAENNETVTYQGVTLQPGDVVNFIGGGATTITGHLLVYGHSSLYLGIDPETHQRSFLDFTVTKFGTSDALPGHPGRDVVSLPYRGRILNEVDFLRDNAASHYGFDVYRLKDFPPMDQATQAAMISEAKRISKTLDWGTDKFCSEAVSAVLAAATHTKISAFTPDELSTGQFERAQELGEKSIGIQPALREAVARSERNSLTDTTTSSMLRGWVATGKPYADSIEPLIANEEREREKARWRDLTEWISAACTYMHTPDNSDLGPESASDEVEYVKAARVALLGHFFVLSEDEIARGLKSSGTQLDSCQTALISTIRSAPAPIDAAWLVQKIEEYRRAERVSRQADMAAYLQRNAEIKDPVIELVAGIAKAIGQGAAILVGGLTEPSAGTYDDVSSEISPSTPQMAAGRAYQRNVATPPIRTGPVFQQLRGIAASGRGIQ